MKYHTVKLLYLHTYQLVQIGNKSVKQFLAAPQNATATTRSTINYQFDFTLNYKYNPDIFNSLLIYVT